MRLAILFSILIGSTVIFSQRGKNGNYTVSGQGEVLNAYTYLTADVGLGSTSIPVNNATLTNAFLTAPLQQGDLIFIHQLQGVSLSLSTWGAENGFYDYTDPLDSTWGGINDAWQYFDSGWHELHEVESVSGNTINLNCGLAHNYAAAGHVVIVRVPRLKSLTVPNNTSITSLNWDGNIGGEVVLEIDSLLQIDTGGEIETNAKGFRGGEYYNNTANGGNGFYGLSTWGLLTQYRAARKGEGVGGYETEYANIYSEYGKGAPGNGGGGGNGHNAGGGGGSNAHLGVYYSGRGVPDPNWSALWDIEQNGLASNPSLGGGRGGYSSSGANVPITTPLGNPAWQSDNRREEGGRGGHYLDYSQGRVWFGGGGGAGEGNDNEGGSGGNGGGLVFLTVYGDFIGNGIVSSNGENGENSEGPNPVFGISGDDGAGGAGAGGVVKINSVANIPNTLTISANGGNGGDNFIKFGAGSGGNYFVAGPGGGGGGGYVATSTGSPSISVSGGVSGVSTGKSVDTEFPPNGATGGSDGIGGGSMTPFDIDIEDDTICGGGDAILTATIIGALPDGATQLTWWDSRYGGTVLGTGTSITLNGLVSNTTVYVGSCPGTFRKAVNILVSPAININGTANVTNTNCGGATGSITGLSASGGAGILVYDWNGTITSGGDLLNAAPGSYTLTVTDENGCTETSGPYTINSISGPSIDSLNYVITPESCAGGDGQITGITATGANPLVYTWNSTVYGTPDIVDASTGTYWLYVEDANNCIDSTGPYTMTQVPGPVIDSLNFSISNSACNGSTGGISGITATGVATLTYEWNGNPSLGPDLANAGVGNYTLVVTDGNGCQDSTGAYSIGQQNPPVIDSVGFALDNTACDTDDGSITGISVTGNSPFTFEWNGVVSGSTDLTGAAMGTYTLVVTDANGCIDSTGVYLIEQESPPMIDSTAYSITDRTCLANDGTISGITVSGNTPYQYFWNGNSSLTINATGLDVGTYTLVVVDANGCSDTTGLYSVGQVADPVIDTSSIVIVPSDCNVNTGEISGILAIGNAPFQYFWNGSFGSIDQTGLAPGLYDLVVVDGNGCDDTLVGLAVGTLNGPVIDDGGLMISDDNCSQGTGAISGIMVSGGTPNYTYSWSNGDPNLDIGSLTAGTYSLTVNDAAGCTASYGPVTIADLSGPSIVETGITITDDFCDLGNGIITGLTVSGNAPFSYSWSNGDTTLAIIGLSQGIYTLTVIDNFGCTATSSDFPVGNTNPNPVDFSWDPDPVTSTDQNVILTATNTAGITYDWFIDDSLVATNINPLDVVLNNSGVYNVCFYLYQGGCSDSVCHPIVVEGDLIIPNVITPNGDGVNERFVITGLLPNTSVTIMNRWGNKVLEVDNYNNDWDGTDMKGLKVSDGEYFYVINVPNGETYQGNLRIFRE